MERNGTERNGKNGMKNGTERNGTERNKKRNGTERNGNGNFFLMPTVYAMPNQDALTVAEKLVNNCFLRFSPPEKLHSDQGRQQFESTLLQDICRILGIHKSHTTAYDPQSDGLVERFNHTLLSMLSTSSQEHPGNMGKSSP